MADLSIDKVNRCYFDERNVQVIESKVHNLRGDEKDDREDIFNIIQKQLFIYDMHFLHQLIGTDNRNTQQLRRLTYCLPPVQIVRTCVITRSWLSIWLCQYFFSMSSSRRSLIGFDAQYVRSLSDAVAR